jgi:hypothetical protein
MVVRFFVVRMCVRKVVLRQLEDDGHQDIKFADDLFPNVAVERRDFIIVLLDDLVSAYVLKGRDGLGDVELYISSAREAIQSRKGEV